MNAAQFIAKWSQVALTERSAAQQHFLDLCEVVGHPKPAEADPAGEWFTFEKGAAKEAGGDGWADVWKRGGFGWEYKGKHKDLDAAYRQLLQYREALENPPLLVVCDLDRIVIHTNFTATAKQVHTIPLAEMGRERNLEILRALFHDPERLRPGATSETITREAAERVGEIAQALRGRGFDPRDVAHFLDRVVFCLFAEDVGLLPGKLFTQILERTRGDKERFVHLTEGLFAAMAHGGDFGVESIRHFNGNLFNGGPVLALTRGEMDALARAAQLDWSSVDPSIFGTLFERGMDPAKRSQLGAHYTSRADIETLVEPVVMQPLRREWAEVRQVFDNLLATGKPRSGPPNPPTLGGYGTADPPTLGGYGMADPPSSGGLGGQAGGKRLRGAALQKARDEADAQIGRFLARLASVKVLDPACGSGNFLYVTLQKLKDLEKEVILFAMERGLPAHFPLVGPWQLHGIEISEYAYDLAQMTVWIGYLQWTRANGFEITEEPLLRAGSNFECKDALLDLTDPDNPKEPEWPRVDYIVGNPPFLGDKLMRRELGDAYVETLRALYAGRVPGGADLCCYWFERARQEIADGDCKRAGLLATQGIRGGANREVLKRIKESGDIFFAESDRPWILDGANVHVSVVAFDSGLETSRVLDSHKVTTINANLATGHGDLTRVHRLKENVGISFIGTTKKGAFDLADGVARAMLEAPNPHGRPTSDVVRPWMNGLDISRRGRCMWAIDFPIDMPEQSAALYQAPFGYVREHVLPERVEHREAVQRKYWWRMARPCPDLRRAATPLDRIVVMPRVAKHRLFRWVDATVVPDCQLIAFARDDDSFLGVLHSRVHELWATAQATQLRERESGLRYTPTTCFETFPFPEPDAGQEAAIAEAARELNALREAWLNPPEWTREEVLEFPGSVDGPWARYVHDPDARGIGTVRYPRLVPRDDACAARLAKRTLTNLYNERPAWLDLAHRRLDEAVFAAYAWPPDLPDEAILEKLLALNLERAGG